MSIIDYSTTPSSNTSLFPENMAPSAVNNGIRQVQADIRDGVIMRRDTKAIMSAIDPSNLAAGDRVYINYRSTEGDGGGGFFRVTKSDISTEVANDPGEGVYVPFDASPGDGTNGGFIRELVGNVATPEMFGADLSGVSNSSTALSSWLNSGKNLVWTKGVYSLNSAITVSSDVQIRIDNAVTLNIDSAVNHGVIFNGFCKIYGGKLTIDCNSNDTYAPLYFNDDLPELDNVHIQNSANFALLTGGQPTGSGTYAGSGRGVFRNIVAEDCVKGPHLYGNTSKTTQLIVENMRTTGTTGSGGNIYFFSDHDIVQVYGGDFSGTSTSSGNIYRTNKAEHIGGKWISLLRGPTFGLDTGKGVITGTYSESCSYSGISTDLRASDGSYPDSYLRISNCVMKNCGYAIYANMNRFDINDVTSYDHQTADSAFRINGGNSEENNIDNLAAWGTGSGVVLRFDKNTVARVGRISHDSTSVLPLVTNAAPSAVTITGATQANPVVITSVGHGLEDGTAIDITSVSGMTELNGNRYVIVSTTTDTFELLNTNGTGYTAYTSGGTATPVAPQAIMSKQASYSANFDMPNDAEMVLIDASSGTVDVDLPSSTFSNHLTRPVTFVCTANSGNNITFTVSGGSNGTINGTTIYTWTTPTAYTAKHAVQTGSGDWLVY